MMWQLFITCYTQLILVAAICHIIGGSIRGVFGFNNRNDVTRFFFNSLTGLTFFVFVYSLMRTHAATINIFLVIPLAYMFISRDNTQKFPLKVFGSLMLSKKTITELFIFSLIAFTWNFAFNTDMFLEVNIPHGDYIFYANIAEHLNLFGVENSLLDYVYAPETLPTPYHYYEIWITAGLNYFTENLSLINLLMIVYPLGMFLSLAGLRTFLPIEKKASLKIIAFCFLLLPISAFSIQNLEQINIFQGASVFTLNSLTYKKFFPIYIFILAALILVREKNIRGLNFILLCMPIITIALAPCVMATIFVLNFFKGDHTKWKAMALNVALMAGFAWFYTQHHPEHVSQNPSGSQLASQLLSVSYLKTSFNIFAKSTLQILFVFSLYLLLLFLLIRKNPMSFKSILFQNRICIILVSCIYFFALAAWAVFHKMFNAVELFNNPVLPLLNLSACLLIAYVFFFLNSTDTKILKGLSLLCVALSLTHSIVELSSAKEKIVYGDEYVSLIKSLTGQLRPLGAYILGSEDYKTIFDKSQAFAVPGKFLKLQLKDSYPVSLSVLQTPRSSDPEIFSIEDVLIKNSSFYKFTEKQKSDYVFKSENQAMLDFVQKHKINYLILGKHGSIPSSLLPKVKAKYNDPLSGETFVLLNN